MTPQTPTVQFASFAYGSRPGTHDPAEGFHEAAKLYPSFAARNIRSALVDEPALLQSLQRSSRRHAHRARVLLPRVPPERARLGDALLRRRSRCPSPGSTLDLDDLAALTVAYEADRASARRAVPSGGALYPLELYVLARRVHGLRPGTYHFDPFERALEELAVGEPGLDGALVDPAAGEGAAALLVVTGMFWRSRCKYGVRGYRFVVLEAGHLVQTVALLATARRIDALPLGGFYDAALDRLVGADGVNESIVYAVAVGRSPR